MKFMVFIKVLVNQAIQKDPIDRVFITIPSVVQSVWIISNKSLLGLAVNNRSFGTFGSFNHAIHLVLTEPVTSDCLSGLLGWISMEFHCTHCTS